jgi:hypothetical protein
MKSETKVQKGNEKWTFINVQNWKVKILFEKKCKNPTCDENAHKNIFCKKKVL